MRRFPCDKVQRMLRSPIPMFVVSSTRRVRSAACAGFRLARWLGVLFVASALVTRGAAQEAPTVSTAPAAPAKDEFASLVKLAPFVVSGKSLAISIFARTRSDRRYGEQFSEGVAKVVYEAVTEQTGKGLVIIGAKGEPHPTLVFRKFLALANDGKLDPAVAAQGAELSAMLDRWQEMLDTKSPKTKADAEAKTDAEPKADVKAKADADTDEDDDLDLDFEKIFVSLPLPLKGVGAKLYQLAWEEKFDDAKVEAKLRALTPGDLERRDRFKSFDWVFYLPPKGAFDRVLDDVIAAMLKKEDFGFLARTAVKGVLLVMKPKIRRSIETMRQGMMFRTVVQAQTQYTQKEVAALAGAYIEALMPFTKAEKKPPGRTDHERAVNAVREQLRKNAEPIQTSEPPPIEPVTTEPARTETAKLAPVD